MTSIEDKIKTFVFNTWGSSNIDRFPGPQPISIERRHFESIKKTKYLVCEKTDGVRHILVCFMDGPNKICALVNRSFQYKLYSLTVHKNTLLDGELIDGYFIVHDAVCINGNDMRSLRLDERLAHINAICKVIIPGQITVVAKKMIPLEEISSIKLHSRTDGIIMTPVNEPVRLGTHRTMFKWKESSRNTIDFIVKGGFLCVQNDSRFVKVQRFEGEENQILECVFRPGKSSDELGTWEPVIIRKDKSHPNNLRTFDRTKINIAENITFDELKNQFGKSS